MDPSTIVGFLLKILPVDKLPKRLRTTLVIAACGVLTYWLAVYALRGADAMQWNVSHGVFLAVFAVVGLAGAALLRAKVSATAETEFLQIHPGEPVYPNLKRPYMTDGAAINEMWNRVARLTEIEKRVRNGTEPIKYPPPSP